MTNTQNIDMYESLLAHTANAGFMPGVNPTALYHGPDRREVERFYERPLIVTSHTDGTIVVWHLGGKSR